MAKILFFLIPGLFLNVHLFAQSDEQFLVKAGTSIQDYFTVSKRYIYPEFITGKIYFKNHSYSERKLNYNYLLGEIEFLERSDTLSIINKEDVELITIAADTFYYDKAYIKLIKSGPPRVGLRELIELKEVQKKDPYGITSPGASSISYNALPSDGNFFKLRANHDMVFKRTRLYYLASEENSFTLFNKKNVYQLFPGQKDKIKSFLKTNKTNFESGEDLLKLAEFLQNL